jgi:hypothetical protein
MKNPNFPSLIMKYSARTFLALLAYFLLMKLFNLATIVELRFFNFFIMFLGIRYFILQLKKENENQLDYLPSLAYGFLVSAFSSLFFAVFIFIYLAYIDKGLMLHLQTHQPFGEYLTPGSSSLVLILEGCSSGAIISFAMVQYMSRETKMKQAD